MTAILRNTDLKSPEFFIEFLTGTLLNIIYYKKM